MIPARATGWRLSSDRRHGYPCGAPAHPDQGHGMSSTIVDLVRAARAHQAEGRLDEAAQLLEQCRQIDSGDINYLIGRADLMRVRGRIDDALACYRQLFRKAPRVPALFDNCALMLVEAGRLGQAEE